LPRNGHDDVVPRRLALALAAGLAALAAVAAAARADKIAFTAADQKTAHAIVLKAADLGAGWKGGAKKPDLSDSKLGCPSVKEKPPAIVATGAAETDFSNGPVDVDSEAEVVQSAAMVAADFHFATLPGIVDCMRRLAAKQFAGKTKLVSIARRSVTHVTPQTAGYRIVVDVKSGTKTVPILLDILFVGKGRTELSLMVAAPAAARRTVQAAETRLARLMASRTPAS
jgi:hypothetical protein